MIPSSKRVTQAYGTSTTQLLARAPFPHSRSDGPVPFSYVSLRRSRAYGLGLPVAGQSLAVRQSSSVDGPCEPTRAGTECGAAQEGAVNRAVGLIDGSTSARARVPQVLPAVHATAQPDGEGPAGGVAPEAPCALWCLP
jgi:hypothetical protein